MRPTSDQAAAAPRQHPVDCWHVSCNYGKQKHRGAEASPLRRPVKQTYADCLTNTPSQPLPLTLENNGPAAAPFSARSTAQRPTNSTVHREVFGLAEVRS